MVVDANATEPGLTRTCTPLYRRVNLEARHHPLSVVSNSPHEMHCSDASCRYNAGSSNPLDYSALLDTPAPCVVEVLRSNTHADHAAKRPLYSGDSDGDSELPWCADFTCVLKNPGKRLVSIDGTNTIRESCLGRSRTVCNRSVKAERPGNEGCNLLLGIRRLNVRLLPPH